MRSLELRHTAQWTPASHFNFGYSTARYWIKVKVANNGASDSNWLLQFGYPLIQIVNFYQFTGSKRLATYKTGRLLPFNSRPIDYHTFLFDFSAPDGTITDLYIMVESLGTLFAPMSIYTKEALLTHSIGKTTAVGIYVGIILAMVLYNFFLFTTIRDKNYLFYIVYASTFCLLLSSLNGMTYQYLWPDWVQWNKVSIPILVGISYLFLALFTQSFLDTKKLAPRWNLGLIPIFAGSLLLIFGGAFSYGFFINRFTSLFIFAAPLIIIPISARCVQLGSPTAIYYLIAFSCFFLGSATHAARDLGWLPANILTENSPYLGSAAEMILLSLGLAVRIKLLKEESLRAELQVSEAERNLAENRRRLERQLAVSALASQVAHDIKSPLAALAVVEKDLSELKEGTRILVRSAVSRIQDIANNLVETTNREINGGIGKSPDLAAFPIATEPAGIELLSGHIDQLISEKRLQFRSQLGVEIDSRLNPSSYGLFAAIPPSEFKRVLSNLINNAVESLPEKGLVAVRLAANGSCTEIRVQDNGKGIPPDVLARLGRRGETHGKAGGSGLGLYHAKTSVESWGGSLTIGSEPGKGTTVTIRLPQARPPEWFVSDLVLSPGAPIVVLDDDASIHQVWQGRFESAHIKDHGIEVLHFSTPAELRSWTKDDAQSAKDALYLLDYELVGYRETGLSLAEELGIGVRTILVTSRYEEKGVLADSLRLKARLIPKSLAGFVPIQIAKEGAPGRFDAVLIDDDPLTRMTWKMAAARAGLKFQSFSTLAEFLKEAPEIDRATPVYIDADLADGVDGAQESLKVRDLGFQEIRLATGHETARFAAYTHLRGVVGKEPPWS